MFFRFATVPAIALTLVATCSTSLPPAGDSGFEAAVQELRANYIAAYGAQDVSALLDFYTDDAVVSMPNQAPVTGRSAIRGLFDTLFATGQTSLRVRSESLRGCGDWGVDSGTSTIQIVTADGTTITQNSSYTVELSKQDGSWKLARVLLSSDDPLPAPEEHKGEDHDQDEH